MLKTKNGITLIALIITIIVLLIIAGTTISLIIGDNGILQKSQTAKLNMEIEQEKETLGLAYSAVRAKKAARGDTSPITDVELNEQFIEDGSDAIAEGNDPIIVTFPSGRQYEVNPTGTITQSENTPSVPPGINFNEIMEEARQNRIGDEEIGIGTDGSIVNMALWNYTQDDENKTINLQGYFLSASDPSYLGDIVDGRIIGVVPQYIMPEGEDVFYTVTAMTGSFVGLEELIYAPVIPSTVKDMSATFFECSNLQAAPRIPDNVIVMWSTFCGCASLTGNLIIDSTEIDVERIDDCLRYVAMKEGCSLELSGASPYVVDIYNTKSDEGHITIKDIIYVAQITLNKTSIDFKVGDEQVLTTTISPSDATVKTIKWITGDETIVGVDSNGKVTARKAGTTTIIAQSRDKNKVIAECNVTVRPCVAFTQNNINYTWADVHEMAKKISARSDINKTSTSATIEYNGNNITLTVGQTMKITNDLGKKYTVRILGFNTDLLASESNYNGTYTYSGTYAGISFEFMDFIEFYSPRCTPDAFPSKSCIMNNNSVKNTGGWYSSYLRQSLTNYSKTGISEINYIKKVEKTYNTGGQGTTNATCSEKLWLLACSEIVSKNSNNIYGASSTNESTMTDGIAETRYAYFAEGNTLEKPNLGYWEYWLRSPFYRSDYDFTVLTEDGTIGSRVQVSKWVGVMPCFCL